MSAPDTANTGSAPQEPWTLGLFLAHALAIEEEAALRYRELAEQMELHHNPDTARLFGELAAAEAEHAQRVRLLIGKRKLPVLMPWQYRWLGAEGPEALPYDSAHYRMTPYHALQLALAAERRAEHFFTACAEHAGQLKVKVLAREFADEEKLHAERIAAALERMPAPPSDWAVDLDPPLCLA
jgi:rubrerythrin